MSASDTKDNLLDDYNLRLVADGEIIEVQDGSDAVRDYLSTVDEHELDENDDGGVDDQLNSDLRHAASMGDVDGCRALLDRGADVDSSAGTGWTALRTAAANGYPSVCALLLEHGADPDAKARGDLPLLQLAVWYGQTAVVDYLVREHGEDLGQLTKEGATLIELAQRSANNEEMVLHLMARQSEKAVGAIDAALEAVESPQESAIPPVHRNKSLSL